MTGRRVTVVASELLGVAGTGGPGTADSLLAVALARGGHRVELLVAPGRGFVQVSSEWRSVYAAANVNVRQLDYRLNVQPAFLAATAEVFEALKDDPPEVVIADDWRGLAYASARSRQLGVALPDTVFVTYCHGPGRSLTESARKIPDTLDRFGEAVAERACIELADAVVSPSAWLLGWMRGHDWPVPESARVIPYLWQSVALGDAAPQAQAAPRVERLAFFGQLREGKGIRVFIASLQQLDPELLHDVELVFLGRETPRWTAERIRAALGSVVGHVSSVRVESGLDRSAALRELLVPGTLAVMPSLSDNSPYAVAECLEHGIPFIGASVGGVPELVAEEDQGRVLCRPLVGELAAALERALASRPQFSPARPARPGRASLDAWLELLNGLTPARPEPRSPMRQVSVVATGGESLRRARHLSERTELAVDVVSAQSRKAGLSAARADWVVFLDDEDDPDDELLASLVAVQAATNADVVTAAVWQNEARDAVYMFLGDPGALGLVENQYGVLALMRRSLLAAQPIDEGIVDPDWPLLARLARSGARVVSIPVPFSVHLGRPGSVADVPGDGVAVLEAFEADNGSPLTDLPQLTATLAAALRRNESERFTGAQHTSSIWPRWARPFSSSGWIAAARRRRRA